MNTELVPFTLDAAFDVVSEINRLHFENLEAARMTIQKATRIGELLKQIKSELKHGEWLSWLGANVTFDVRTAQRYIRVYKNPDTAEIQQRVVFDRRLPNANHRR